VVSYCSFNWRRQEALGRNGGRGLTTAVARPAMPLTTRPLFSVLYLQRTACSCVTTWLTTCPLPITWTEAKSGLFSFCLRATSSCVTTWLTTSLDLRDQTRAKTGLDIDALSRGCLQLCLYLSTFANLE